MHKSHNEFEWDFIVSRKLDCETFKSPIDVICIITMLLGINNIIAHKKLDDKKVQMQITKVGGLEISGEEMGGDLN